MTFFGFVLATAGCSDAKTPGRDAKESVDGCADCDGSSDSGDGDIGGDGASPDLIPACTELAPNDGGATGGDTDANCSSGWCLVSGGMPAPGPYLLGVWGTGPDDAWAVGHFGVINHWDGAAWTTVVSGNEQDLFAVWASSKTDAWAVGLNGTIRHWDGAAWTTVVPGNGQDLFAVWGAGPDDVWAVGWAGTVLHWDGVAWSAVASGTGENLTSVSGSGTADVWATGRFGIVHWDGTSWSENFGPVAEPGNAIWASSPRDAWNVGGWNVGGTHLLHWDGVGWTSQTSGGDFAGNVGLWGTGPTDVWAVGDNGVIRHFNGVEWTISSTGIALGLRAVWGSGANDVWAVGDGVILHWNGDAWSRVFSDKGTPATQDARVTTQALVRVWGTSPTDAWAVGGSTPALASAILHWNGKAWSAVNGAPQVAGLTSGWSISQSDIWFVGPNVFIGGVPVGGYVLRLSGPAGTPLGPGAPMSSRGLTDVWGSGPDDVWVVGDTGDGNGPYHWDGSAWSVPPGSFAFQGFTLSLLTSVWGSGRGDVWVGGRLGIAHWDGSAWSPNGSSTGEVITRIWGSGPNDVWAIGSDLMHWNGTAWTVTCRAPSVTSGLVAVTGSGPNDVWFMTAPSPRRVGGAVNTTLHWDGTRFTSDVSTFGLLDLWSSGPGDVWGVGEKGTIVHHAAP